MANATSTYASGQRSIARKRKERRQLLDHMERVTGLNRKTLIRHMNGKVHRKPRRKQRANTYGREVDDGLRVISETLDYISAQCLIPHLVTMAQDLIMHGQLELSAGLPENLGRISAATVRRRLKKFAQLEQWRLPQRQGPTQRSTVTRSTSKGRTPAEAPRAGDIGGASSGADTCRMERGSEIAWLRLRHTTLPRRAFA